MFKIGDMVIYLGMEFFIDDIFDDGTIWIVDDPVNTSFECHVYFSQVRMVFGKEK